MTTQEFSDQFDVLYNNIMSNQAPGLDEYEKSVFLTKAQDELVKAYFNPKENKILEGFDDNERRQIDFSMLMRTVTPTFASSSVPDIHGGSNTQYFVMPADILLYINESLTVSRGGENIRLTVVPVNYIEYNRLMSKPFKRPLKNQAWRLITSGAAGAYTYTDYSAIAVSLSNIAEAEAAGTSAEEFFSAINGEILTVETVSTSKYLNILGKGYIKADASFSDTASSSMALPNIVATNIRNNINKTVAATSTVIEIIPGPSDQIGSNSYIVRYVSRPTPIITANLTGENVSINGKTTAMTSQLDPILHQEILQRAVELAKAAYTGDLTSQIALGINSATEKGVIQTSR